MSIAKITQTLSSTLSTGYDEAADEEDVEGNDDEGYDFELQQI